VSVPGVIAGVAVVDVDSLIAEPRRSASELPGAINQHDFCDLRLAVISALAIQSRPGLVRIVHYEPDRTLSLLVRELLVGENVDVLLGAEPGRACRASQVGLPGGL
jgi:hypothetical protein